jgi:hypothetical protein
MTPEHEIWLPASTKKMTGHVRVWGEGIAIYTGRLYIRHRYPNIPHAVTTIGLSKDFFCVHQVVYYVNGRAEVYQTNIQIPYPSKSKVTYFDPVGRMADNTPVLFRKLHKLEWLFA